MIPQLPFVSMSVQAAELSTSLWLSATSHLPTLRAIIPEKDKKK